MKHRLHNAIIQHDLSNLTMKIRERKDSAKEYPDCLVTSKYPSLARQLIDLEKSFVGEGEENKARKEFKDLLVFSMDIATSSRFQSEIFCIVETACMLKCEEILVSAFIKYSMDTEMNFLDYRKMQIFLLKSTLKDAKKINEQFYTRVFISCVESFVAGKFTKQPDFDQKIKSFIGSSFSSYSIDEFKNIVEEANTDQVMAQLSQASTEDKNEEKKQEVAKLSPIPLLPFGDLINQILSLRDVQEFIHLHTIAPEFISGAGYFNLRARNLNLKIPTDITRYVGRFFFQNSDPKEPEASSVDERPLPSPP